MAALPEPLSYEGQHVLERIIVPLDGSARAEQVLHLVVPLAQQLGSVLTLLHVLLPRHETPGRPGEISYPDALHDRARALATDYLAEVSRNIVQERVRTKTVVAAGRVSDMILAHAEHGSFSMIAAGARPRPRILRLFREGIAETVWAKSRAPLLLWMPDEQEEEFPVVEMPRRIVVPMNGSARSETALEYARQVASAAGLSVTVLGVRAAKVILPPNGRLEAEYAGDPEGYLAAKVVELKGTGVDADAMWRDEKIAVALRSVEGDLPPHIVTMAGGRRPTFYRSLFGYTVAQMARRTDCPMIFLPPGYEPPGRLPQRPRPGDEKTS